MNKTEDEGFVSFIKCSFCDNVYVDSDVEIRDHCHMARKYRSSAHGDVLFFLNSNFHFYFVTLFSDFNMNVTLNHEINRVFQHLKICESHLYM